MRILIVGINYAPELTGIGKYTGEMGSWLADRGHEVKVVTAPPYYPMWEIKDGYSALKYRVEKIEGVEIHRCPLWVPERPTGVKRILHLVSFSVGTLPAFLHVLVRWRPHIVLNIAPAFSSAPLSLFFSRMAGAKAWLHIQDFEIDAAFNLGLLSGSLSRRIVSRFEKAILKSFDIVSTLSDGMLEKLLLKGVPDNRTMLFPNWADLDRLFPIEDTTAFKKERDIPLDKIVALYSGSLGNKQGIELLIDAAKQAEEIRDLHFVICGDGSSLHFVRSAMDGFSNVSLLPLQPVNRLNDLLNIADIHLLPQREDVADLVMPSKLTGMLASGKPVLAAANKGTEVARVVQQCGIVVPPGDSGAFLEALLLLSKDVERRRQLGEIGRAYAVQNLNKVKILDGLELTLNQLKRGDGLLEDSPLIGKGSC